MIGGGKGRVFWVGGIYVVIIEICLLMEGSWFGWVGIWSGRDRRVEGRIGF